MFSYKSLAATFFAAFTITISGTAAFANGDCDRSASPAKVIENAEKCESKAHANSDQAATDDSAQQSVASEPGKNIIYFAAGVSRRTSEFDNSVPGISGFDNNEAAFTGGYLRLSNKSRLLGGFDVSYEGTMLDGTYGRYSTEGAFSFNGIVGFNAVKKGSFRADVAGLVGIRQKTKDCPSSYIGFQCYADTRPSIGYSLNYGGILALSFKRVTVGARVTGVSTQGLVGIRF